MYRQLSKLNLSPSDAKVRELADKYGLRANGEFDMAKDLSVTQLQAGRSGGMPEAK